MDGEGDGVSHTPDADLDDRRTRALVQRLPTKDPDESPTMVGDTTEIILGLDFEQIYDLQTKVTKPISDQLRENSK